MREDMSEPFSPVGSHDLTTEERPAKSRTPLFVAGLVILIAVVAFFAGRATGISAGEARVLEQQAAQQAAEQASADAEAAAEEAARAGTFVRALDLCGVARGTATYATLGDNNSTLDIDQNGSDDRGRGMPITEYWCILDELDVPDRVKSDMGNTTSMDGRREASWDGITASWSYHPDRGLDTVLYLED